LPLSLQILFNHHDHTSSTVALRDIPRGEEVCHSYISLQDLPGVRERRAWLERQHGFRCSCERCEEEEEEARRRSCLSLRLRKRGRRKEEEEQQQEQEAEEETAARKVQK
jgi:hypothetical protein